MIFTRFARVNGTASTLALGLALATGVVLGGAALESPAFAQKKSKAAKPSYSKAFIAAYGPLQALLAAETPDLAAMKAAIPAVVAAVETDDDRFAAGGVLVNISQKANDLGLAAQGLEMMLASGKVAPEQVGLYNFQAGQIAYNQKNYPKARTLLQAALTAGYTENTPETYIAESYFAEEKTSEGLAYLSGVIDGRKAAGQPVDENWIKRGLAVAYNGQMKAEAQRYATLYVSEFPGEQSWGDAVAIMLNTGGYQNPEILDLLRLGRRAGTLRDDRLYMEYVDAADYRRLPGEVVSVIDEGLARGLLPKNDPYVTDTRRQAAERVAADKADMTNLMRDARASGASIATVMAAGDALLSLGRPAEAEEFYGKAASTAGANTPMVLTRLGIAQFDQGKFTEAQATFNKVEGARQAIANLWGIYTAQKASSGM
ncbi:hypothetical protein [Qipengyuania zhejiangensis]|uniref:hypothetical protein n=1 Tax=Qipengyuania zhejiangensis TaxID=3077782 RepID=UPI002D77B783|nr:hypothetical protein [Qipengyuania sp. Z2]